MSNIRIELNSEGIQELLKSQEMQSTLQEIANDVQSRCGEGYETDIAVMQTRAIASVYTADEFAVADNSSNNTLLKALG